jgi:transmembrane sensor
MATHQHIAQLMYRHLSGTISAPEAAELDGWVNQSDDHRLLFEEVNDHEQLGSYIALMHPDEWAVIDASIAQKIREGIATKEEPARAVPAHRVHFLKTAFFRYAAAILILIGVGTYLYITDQNEKPAATTTFNPLPVQNDVKPGGNKATLTLADGSKINLDSAGNGRLAQERGARIEKRGGQVVYVPILPARERPGVVVYNTMMTPRGGQYELTLPDGSQVWLNAESSITYPTAFTGNERKVTITGEAYFEVAKDKTKKFIVSVAGKQEVEVLGTHFNVNAYKEEPIINTTLLEGSVRIESNFVHTSLILKPGQQGQLTDRGLSLAANPDIEQVMAWKNGAFNFDKMDITVALRQIERWYDVEVIYPNGVATKRLIGGMGRDLNLSEVLKVLEGVGVKAELKDRKLYISQL